MDVSTMLHNGALDADGSADGRTHSRPYQDRKHEITQQQPSFPANPYTSNVSRAIRHDNIAATGTAYPRASPTKKDQKHVVFQLIDPEDPRIQARLPMRVMISPHDNTESIITTVKNFYGLYDYGVSFENKEGISIIAAYDNFEQDMTVFVRTVAQPASIKADAARNSISPQKAPLGAPFEMRAPHHSTANSPSRTAARSAGLRSMSPQSELGRRSTSAAPGARARSHRAKSKDNSVVGDADGYSSDENGEGSVTSSRRSKQEQVNAEISVDNIVEGGRRKRAFESSVRVQLHIKLLPVANVFSGAAIVCTASGAYDRIHLVHFAPAPQWTRQRCISIRLPPSIDFLLHPTFAFAPKLW